MNDDLTLADVRDMWTQVGEVLARIGPPLATPELCAWVALHVDEDELRKSARFMGVHC